MIYEEYLTTDEINIAFLKMGDPTKPPLLLLHGYLDLAHAWLPVAERLVEDFHIVAPHFRGHGDSDWAGGFAYMMPHYLYDIACLVKHLGWRSFHLAGHSMGANCASLYAGAYPKQVETLTLLEGFGTPFWSPEQAPEKLIDHIEARQQGADRHAGYESLERVVQKLQQITPHAAPAWLQRLAAYATKKAPDGRWYWKHDPALRLPNPVMYLQSQFIAFWRRITCPTVQVLGKESIYLPFLDAPSFQAIPHLQSTLIEKAGHGLHQEQPDAIAELLCAFTQGHAHHLQDAQTLFATL
jgi:pimeloyl-ACP methyl ester carboxylesterase